MMHVGGWWEAPPNCAVARLKRRSSEEKKRRTIASFREEGADVARLRHEAAVKIQVAMRHRLGRKYVETATVKGTLHSVPAETRIHIRERVQEILRDEIPPYTPESWCFEQPWDPFVLGSKLQVTHHPLVRDKKHPFARMMDLMNPTGVIGTESGHEPLGSHRIWAATQHRTNAAQALERTMAAAWPSET
jgi:hypothetical protein